MGDGWSVAWRTHDAQYWGVRQRRKRISLVADFGGRTAPEILFECKSVPRNTEPGGEERKRPSEGTEGSVRNSSGFDGNTGAKAGNIGYAQEQSPTLTAGKIMNVISFEPGIMSKVEIAKTLDCFDPNPSKNQGGVAVLQTFDARGNGDGKTVCTITGDHENRVTDYTALCIGNGQADQLRLHEKVGALNCMHDQQAVVSFPQEIHDFVKENNLDVAHQQDLLQTSDGVSRTLAPGTHAAGSHLTKTIVKNEQGFSVRRLTPLECERLQGFPDGWTDIGDWIDSKGKKHDSSDSARYKALGNSIALPFWRFLCKRISAQYARRATMASLFDGIGGFPLVWEEWNGKGSAVWASEIEEFPIAVTKYHFGEER